MKYLIPFLLALPSCANVSTTKFTYREASGVTVTVEMPKEMEAKNLSVDINAKEGKAVIRAEKIQTLNSATIAAQSARETGNIKEASKIAENVTKAAVESAVKSAVPIP